MSAPPMQGDGAALVPPPGHTTAETYPSFLHAFAAFQADLPAITKGARGQVQGRRDYRYADLADVSAKVLPALGRYGLSFSARPTMQDGRFVLAYALRHESGKGEDVGTWPLTESSNSQAMGSAITYARRYCLCAVTGVAPEDDDDDAAAAVADQRENRRRGEARDQAPPAGGDDREPDATGQTRTASARALSLAAASLARRLLAADRAAVKGMWDEVKDSPAREVDVSGLLDAELRDAFGIAERQPVTVLALRGLVAANLAAQRPAARAADEPAAEPAADAGEIM
jgi:hypothetical protein